MPQHKQMLTLHKLFVRLLLVVHNTLYSYCTAIKPLFPKPRNIPILASKMSWVLLLLLLGIIKDTYDEGFTAYVAGKTLLFKISEFQKQPHLKLFKTQTQKPVCLYFHYFRLLKDV